MKVIETVYQGYRFRSRLEARWAVFFDALGEPWEYEKEGYNLDGVWYLPDFWLPRLHCFVEIKGEYPSLVELYKCQALSLSTGVMICYGLPLRHSSILYCRENGEPTSRTVDWCYNGRGQLCLYVPDWDESKTMMMSDWDNLFMPSLFYDTTGLTGAATMAKQARFDGTDIVGRELPSIVDYDGIAF